MSVLTTKQSTPILKSSYDNVHNTKVIRSRITKLCSQNTKNVINDKKLAIKLANNNIVTGIIDMIINDHKSNSKLYVILRGSDTFPASIADVAMLKAIRDENRKKGEKEHRYMIFCEEGDNNDTKTLARGFYINYVDHEKYLKGELRGYFSDIG